MKHIKLIFLLFILPCLSYAQTHYTVKGEIRTKDGYTPSGNVIALNNQDSSFIKGDFFLDGSFVLEGLQEKHLLIKLTSLEFDDTYLSINHKGQEVIDLGIITPSESMVALDEVVIKSKRPVFTQQADGTISVLVANTTLASSNNINEVLSRSPDVLVNSDGEVSIFGKGNAIFYLNGTRVTRHRLSLISPSQVNKIEIIRNPSAKYDAEGAAVINIVTNRKDLYSQQININQNITYSEFAGSDRYTSIDLNLNKGPLSSFANYSLLKGNDRHILSTTRNRDSEEVFVKTDLITEWKNRYENFSNYGLGVQYNFSESKYLSVEYAGLQEQLGGHQISNNTIAERSGLNYYESDIARDELDKNSSISVNYNQSLDTLGSSLFFGVQYAKISSSIDNDIEEDRSELGIQSSRMLKNLSGLNLNILSAQLDWTKAIKDQNTLEYGIKFSKISNSSESNFFSSQEDNSFAFEQALSNRFKYQEKVLAAYVNLNKKISNSISSSIGLRTEQTGYSLKLSQLDNQLIEDEYINFFPKLSINKKFSDGYNLNLSYNARISRVPYQRLNPVLIYQDPYTSIQGNPESISEKIHNIELTAKLDQLNLKTGYSLTLDPFGGGALRGEDGKSYILKRFNFQSSHLYYTSLSRTFNTNWLSSTNTASVRFTNIIDNEFDFAQVGTKPQFYFYSNNRIPVSNLFNTELTFWYIGKEYEGVYVRENSKNLSLSFDKKLFDDALTFRLTFSDIFHTVKAAGDYDIGETHIYFHRKWNTSHVRLSVKYNFGKLNDKKYSNKAIGESESNRGN